MAGGVTGFENSLFGADAPRPLADRLRPKTIDDVVGQDHLLGPEGSIRRFLDQGRLTSLILWGTPGCGKTTIARLLADHTDLAFEPLSAIFSGVADLRKVFDRAESRRMQGQGTCLFVDEIHRFNKAQQDSFLPYVENGTIILVGATTENPSFELNAALLSRCQVFVLNRLEHDAFETMLQRAEEEEDRKLPLTQEARWALMDMADGDGRYLLNMAEALYALGTSNEMDVEELGRVVQKRLPVYDKGQDSHYNLVSALHKAVRGSDVDAALYWLGRMLEGGEDPNFIARRLLVMSYEDIGMADPNAAVQALNAWQTFERLGNPEGQMALSQAVVYLATAPKSNAQYKSLKAAKGLAKETGSLPPPKHILNAPTKMMREMGYGVGYQYDHDSEDGFSGQNFFPENLAREKLYQPVERGFERDVNKRLEYWEGLRKKRNKI
ncbi:replication-associated recombination protein A [Curvivirga aplysinae]|uniref:replication-associated recombination protein A n=1 Tax=Curvivirga aplysinae TaxID=2529852 RepID=UPI0012BCA442|nr:replication-associated recombination protein A [Curvivirga aplysinae]MTI11270.1 replication-associated recombination protein A [Curvivirga aplysinae]